MNVRYNYLLAARIWRNCLLLLTLESLVGRPRLDAFIKGCFARFSFQAMDTATFLGHLRSALLDEDPGLEARLLALHNRERSATGARALVFRHSVGLTIMIGDPTAAVKSMSRCTPSSAPRRISASGWARSSASL